MLALLLSRAQRGAMARTDYSTRGNKDALSIQGSAMQSEVGGQPLELVRERKHHPFLSKQATRLSLLRQLNWISSIARR